jgi:hypothetical protein
MRRFTISQKPIGPDRSTCWCVESEGEQSWQYSCQWAAIIGAVVAAHDATHEGEEATVAMETTANQVWTFSLLPCGREQAGTKPGTEAAVRGTAGNG